MKNTLRNILVLVILFISQLASAQQVITAEYFWDVDPGLGNGTLITALDGNLDEAIEDLFTSSVSIPTTGLHTFNIRIKGLENTWSSLFSYVINVGSPTLMSRDVKVVQAEYFWDTDPGVGNATTILALDGNLDEAIEDLFNSSVSVPSAGVHTFNIRIKGLDNSWSNLFSYVINVGTPTLISRDVTVTQGEYFWDTDPGAGSATPILAFDGNLDEALENLFDGSIPSPSAGIHTFNLRVKGFDGSWSSPFAYVINVENGALLTRDMKVTQAEYFWDTDPGAGNATVILALDGNLDEAIEDLFESAVSIPSNGVHTFNIRVKGLDNSWSTTFSYVMNVGTPTLISRDVKVIQAEYFWDVDPGLGSGSPILALDGNLDEAVEDVFQNTLTSTSIGLHVFNLRVKGQDNSWSTTFKYAVDVLDSNSYETINESICDGDTYTVPSGDEMYSVTGVYSDTLLNANGFDSIITINLFVQPPVFSTISPTACGSYLSPEGNIYTSSGTYTDVIQTVIGCDSTITINLTIEPNSFATISVGACDSYTSPSGNYVYTSSGTYMDTIPSASGCDSILTIDLIISSATSTTQTITVCDSYLWSATGLTYNTSGTYMATLVNSIGCDSLITLNLTVNYSYSNSSAITTCDSYFWPRDGNTYTSSGMYSASYFKTNGCDSTYFLDLTILNSTTATETVITCDTFTWNLNGTLYNSSGIFSTTIPNAAGCDSIVALDLTINYSSDSITDIVSCDSYFWPISGLTYTSSGQYVLTSTNAAGCDSSVILNLTIGTTSNTTDVVSACDSYFWSANGMTYTTSGMHTETLLTPEGCDSIVTLDLTINQNSTGTQTTTACDSYTWPVTGLAYTTSGTYTGIISNATGCDSVITLNLAINYSTGSSQTIVACDSYTWPENGVTYTNTGMYTFTIPNSVGCDSVITLNLTIGNSSSSTEVVSACDSYTWAANGTTYTNTGLYSATFPGANGCDSTLNLDLTINSSSTATVNLVACDLYTWPLNGNSYASSGTYFATIPNAAGCDSVVTLNLSITNSSSTVETVSACNSYTWPVNGNTYTVSGSYQTILTNAVGCDSIVTLELTVGYSYNDNITITACDNYTWAANGQTYTTSGIYSVTTFTSLGCDSISTLDLTIGTSSSSTQTISACDSYTWSANGTSYTSSGTFTETIPNSFGCDSVVTLDLTINSSSSGSETVSACESYFWSTSGSTYTSSGAYTAVLTNSVGCDSTVTLNLTINSSYSNTEVIATCGSYVWAANGTTYSSSGFYTESLTTAAGCDSILNLDLTITNGSSSSATISVCNEYFWSATGQTYTNSGTYQTTLPGQGGCDSTLILNLTVTNLNANLFQSDNVLTASPSGGTYEWLNCTTGAPVVGETGQEFTAMTNGDYAVVVSLNGCSDTSNCVTVDNVDIDQHFLESLSLYPNPTDGKFTIDLGEFKDNATITLRDVRGRLLQTNEYINVESIDIFLEYPTGMYFVEVRSNTEKAVLRVVLK